MQHQVSAECEASREPDGAAGRPTDGPARDGILILDSESALVVDSNPFLTEILGYPREELLGRTLRGLGFLGYSVHGDTLFEKVRREGYVRCTALRLKTCGGRCILVEFVGNAYHVDNKMVVQFNVGNVRACPLLERGDARADAPEPVPS
jgi:PAS domain S-box-containing protein